MSSITLSPLDSHIFKKTTDEVLDLRGIVIPASLEEWKVILVKNLSENKLKVLLEVNISNTRGWNITNFELFLNILNNANNLERLIMKDCELTPEYMSIIARFCSRPASIISSLDLQNNNISDEGLEKFSKALLDSCLKYLDSDNNENNNIINFKKNYSLNLKFLNFSYNNISVHGILSLTKLILQLVAKGLPKKFFFPLRSLDFKGNNLTDHSLQCLYPLLTLNQKVNVVATSSQTPAHLQSNFALIELILDDNLKITTKGIKSMLEYILSPPTDENVKYSSSPSLRNLSLSNTQAVTSTNFLSYVCNKFLSKFPLSSLYLGISVTQSENLIKESTKRRLENSSRETFIVNTSVLDDALLTKLFEIAEEESEGRDPLKIKLNSEVSVAEISLSQALYEVSTGINSSLSIENFFLGYLPQIVYQECHLSYARLKKSITSTDIETFIDSYSSLLSINKMHEILCIPHISDCKNWILTGVYEQTKEIGSTTSKFSSPFSTKENINIQTIPSTTSNTAFSTPNTHSTVNLVHNNSTNTNPTPSSMSSLLALLEKQYLRARNSHSSALHTLSSEIFKLVEHSPSKLSKNENDENLIIEDLFKKLSSMNSSDSNNSNDSSFLDDESFSKQDKEEMHALDGVNPPYAGTPQKERIAGVSEEVRNALSSLTLIMDKYSKENEKEEEKSQKLNNEMEKNQVQTNSSTITNTTITSTFEEEIQKVVKETLTKVLSEKDILKTTTNNESNSSVSNSQQASSITPSTPSVTQLSSSIPSSSTAIIPSFESIIINIQQELTRNQNDIRFVNQQHQQLESKVNQSFSDYDKRLNRLEKALNFSDNETSSAQGLPSTPINSNLLSSNPFLSTASSFNSTTTTNNNNNNNLVPPLVNEMMQRLDIIEHLLLLENVFPNQGNKSNITASPNSSQIINPNQLSPNVALSQTLRNTLVNRYPLENNNEIYPIPNNLDHSNQPVTTPYNSTQPQFFTPYQQPYQPQHTNQQFYQQTPQQFLHQQIPSQQILQQQQKQHFQQNIPQGHNQQYQDQNIDGDEIFDESFSIKDSSEEYIKDPKRSKRDNTGSLYAKLSKSLNTNQPPNSISHATPARIESRQQRPPTTGEFQGSSYSPLPTPILPNADPSLENIVNDNESFAPTPRSSLTNKNYKDDNSETNRKDRHQVFDFNETINNTPLPPLPYLTQGYYGEENSFEYPSSSLKSNRQIIPKKPTTSPARSRSSSAERSIGLSTTPSSSKSTTVSRGPKNYLAPTYSSISRNPHQLNQFRKSAKIN